MNTKLPFINSQQSLQETNSQKIIQVPSKLSSIHRDQSPNSFKIKQTLDLKRFRYKPEAQKDMTWNLSRQFNIVEENIMQYTKKAQKYIENKKVNKIMQSNAFSQQNINNNSNFMYSKAAESHYKTSIKNFNIPQVRSLSPILSNQGTHKNRIQTSKENNFRPGHSADRKINKNYQTDGFNYPKINLNSKQKNSNQKSPYKSTNDDILKYEQQLEESISKITNLEQDDPEDNKLPYRLFVITKIRKVIIEEIIKSKELGGFNPQNMNNQLMDMIRKKVIPEENKDLFLKIIQEQNKKVKIKDKQNYTRKQQTNNPLMQLQQQQKKKEEKEKQNNNDNDNNDTQIALQLIKQNSIPNITIN